MKNKKIFFHIFIIILIAVPLYFMFHAWGEANAKSNPSYKYETVTAIEPKVYVTNTGDCYHSASCGYLHSSIAKGKYQAQNEGYRACSACHGASSGTIEVTYQKRVLDTSDSKSIGLCIALALLTAPFIYLALYSGLQSYKENRKVKTSSPKVAVANDGPNIGKTIYKDDPPTKLITQKSVKRNKPPIGTLVMHATYGRGIIQMIDDRIVYVSFNDETAEDKWKKFQYPQAFDDGYLIEIPDLLK